ncbi:MAG: hypothetical protein IPK04_02535 [Bdellovibrionales bacterium]|nr:hypothetical protein [Bdellovibrionales bacterium]
MKRFFFRSNRLSVALLTAILLLGFQNCGQPGSISLSPQADITKKEDLIDQNGNSDAGDRNPSSGTSVGSSGGGPAGPGTGTGTGTSTSTAPMGPQTYTTETYVTTKLNTPIEFTLTALLEPKLTGLTVDVSSISSQTGILNRIAGADFQFKYSPNFGYRGREVLTISAKDSQQNLVKFNVTIVVGNPLQLIKPALAIRGMGCIQCHARVKSNIITDFGYGSPFYFNENMGGSWWKSGGLYGDHANAFSTMKLSPTVNVIVPSAPLPSRIAGLTGTSILARYIQSRFAVADDPDTKNVLVKEKSKVYIGAPSDSDVVRDFSLSSGTRLAYFKNSETALPLSGLSDKNTYFKNEGVLNCEGDVALRGPAYFVNLQVNSATGCRIYVIGSVFIFGQISQTNASETRNLQITSTRSINMGLGAMKKNNAFCDPNSSYATDTANFGTSSLTNRYYSFWTVPSQVVRGELNPSAFGASVLAEATAIESKEGVLLDASCRPEGRNVSFDRILLNAPSVQSRYEGDIIGTIIAEYSIMSLGKFKFQYDEVFDKVPILPFFDNKIYLDIED